MENLMTHNWYTIQNNSGTPELLIYSTIGQGDCKAEALIKQLQPLSAIPLLVRINSPGGSVFDGLAIYNSLKARTAATIVRVEGMAASAASFIAMAGDEIQMHKSSYLMIHDPYSLVLGGSEELRKEAETLDKIKDTIASIYTTRTGKPLAEILKLMDNETWLDADEAKAEGFCDTVLADAKGTPANRFDLSKFAKVPSQVMNAYGLQNQPANVHEAIAAAEWNRMTEAERLRWTDRENYIRVRRIEQEGRLNGRPRMEGYVNMDQAKQAAKAEWAKMDAGERSRWISEEVFVSSRVVEARGQYR
jgi:ATP-dependent Clp endopeptidase proteolytic subunit ClpP